MAYHQYVSNEPLRTNASEIWIKRQKFSLQKMHFTMYCINVVHFVQTPWYRIYASVNRVSISSDNGLSPIRRQAITWTNAGVLSIWQLGTDFNEIRIGILLFSFKKMHLKLSSAKMLAILSSGDELTHAVSADRARQVLSFVGRCCLLLKTNQCNICGNRSVGISENYVCSCFVALHMLPMCWYLPTA